MANYNTTLGDHAPDDNVGANPVGAHVLSESDEFLHNELLRAERIVARTSAPAEEPLVTRSPPPLRHYAYTPHMLPLGAWDQVEKETLRLLLNQVVQNYGEMVLLSTPDNAPGNTPDPST
ncbi:hypothetical protein PG996_003399 [Apiospora saccharicola]|uniref:Uncharacterized protein n=1 Tax=Apiospora saccharicola TaxID=335842 RepID=A0ABR1W157_9PEZI